MVLFRSRPKISSSSRPKTALITGITGQDGTYLTKLLLRKGYQVFGLRRAEYREHYNNFQKTFPDVRMVDGDMTNAALLCRAVDSIQPDEVYNFAAMSSPALSFKQPEVTADINATGVVRLLEAIRQACGENSTIRFFQASSCHLFGDTTISPQSETTAFNPASPYACAKAFAHFVTVNYRQAYGLHASCGLLFNHESALRSTNFVTRKITNSVARIKLGLQQDIVLGNLESERDWGFAGDYVEGMWLMLQQDQPDDYVLATGQKHSIRDWLQVAFEQVGIRDWEHYIKQDPAFMHPTDIGQLVGDSTKARSHLGWVPKVRFEELVQMMVESDLVTESNKQSQ